MANDRCSDVQLGTYACALAVYLPYKFKDGTYHFVSVDQCLLPELIRLWACGVHTTGCCCGHGAKEKAYIGVEEKDIPTMKRMGYLVHPNPTRPYAEDSFIPKTNLAYSNLIQMQRASVFGTEQADVPLEPPRMLEQVFDRKIADLQKEKREYLSLFGLEEQNGA